MWYNGIVAAYGYRIKELGPSVGWEAVNFYSVCAVTTLYASPATSANASIDKIRYRDLITILLVVI